MRGMNRIDVSDLIAGLIAVGCTGDKRSKGGGGSQKRVMTNKAFFMRISALDGSVLLLAVLLCIFRPPIVMAQGAGASEHRQGEQPPEFKFHLSIEYCGRMYPGTSDRQN